MATALMSRFSYPKVPGDSLWSIVDVTGPASYVPPSVGVSPTGGQPITAADFGLQSIDWIGTMGSPGAQYNVIVIPTSTIGAPFNAARLMWLGVTGTAVSPGANLSGNTVRLLAIGR